MVESMTEILSILNICEFKISLQGTKPEIWRRIQVPERYTFYDFHIAIQKAMGWNYQTSHLHAFHVRDPKTGQMICIGIPDNYGSSYMKVIPERNVILTDYFTTSHSRFCYEYDFRNSWMHDIVLEKKIRSSSGIFYPRCVGGGMACPPEGCGGLKGYADHLDIITHPHHPKYVQHLQWLRSIEFHPKSYNPLYFDSSRVFFDCPKNNNEDRNILKVYQFRVTLIRIKPRIWRRILVPENFTFHELHVSIQKCMGWKSNIENFHLHKFHCKDPISGVPVIFGIPGDGVCIDGEVTLLSDHFATSNSKIYYEYDLSSKWIHEVVLERIILGVPGVKYPKIIAGQQPCPPEDCGGVRGYKNLMKVFSNSKQSVLGKSAFSGTTAFDSEFLVLKNIVNPSQLEVPVASSTFQSVLQLKISLKHIQPTIWRRILIPDDFTFHDLHFVIQKAMGWKSWIVDYNHHEFHIENELTGRILKIGSSYCFKDVRLGRNTKVTKYISSDVKCYYLYDFIDDWQHDIVLEKVIPAMPNTVYPKCIGGCRACPPESCGGPTGYKQHIAIISNPDHAEYKDHVKKLQAIEYYPRFYNPDYFDAAEISFLNSRKLASADYHETADYVYQFKVILQSISPEIWRRFRVPESFTFENLHIAVQKCMGWHSWRNTLHLHAFFVRDPRTNMEVEIGISGNGRTVPESKALLSKYLRHPNSKLRYEYNFRCSWMHVLILEKIFPAARNAVYPQCVSGARACPPEECNGVKEYEIITDHWNPERKKHLENLGIDNFEPDFFDPSSIDFAND